MSAHVRILLALLCVVVSATACQQGADAPTGPGAPAAELSINGPDVLDGPGSTVTLTATFTQNGQNTDVTAATQWVTNNPSILNILSPGVISAVALGGANVFATHQGRTVSRRVIVAREEDCQQYNPLDVILQENPNPVGPLDIRWRIGYPLVLPDLGPVIALLGSFENGDDAVDGLALAQRHTRQCSGGRSYGGADRASYIVGYWGGSSGAQTTIQRDDCDAYDPARLDVRFDAPGWTVFDGNTRVARLYFEEDAGRILSVARQHRARCYIGRGRPRNGTNAYNLTYFR